MIHERTQSMLLKDPLVASGFEAADEILAV
jgi:hypothetical protein